MSTIQEILEKSYLSMRGVLSEDDKQLEHDLYTVITHDELNEEQIEELSKKVLGNYINKASSNSAENASKAVDPYDSQKNRTANFDKTIKRLGGIKTAVGKLTKEEVELEESWDAGAGNSPRDSLRAIKFRKEAKQHHSDAKDFEVGDPNHHKAMANYHDSMAKAVKHGYHAGEYGSKSEAKAEHDDHMKKKKEHLAKSRVDESSNPLVKAYLNELSKSTLKNYSATASMAAAHHMSVAAHTPSQEAKLFHAKKGADRIKGVMRASKKLNKEDVEYIESLLDEVVDELVTEITVDHSRYVRNHGKKAKGQGSWMFTHKHKGDVDYNDKKDVHTVNGSFGEASKSAKEWAKEHGHKSVYVMESSENQDDYSLTEALKPYNSGRSILPASDALHNKSKSTLADVGETWKDKMTVQVVKKANGKHAYIAGAGHSREDIGTTFKAKHDQSFRDLGHHEIVNNIHLDGGKVVHKDNDIGTDKAHKLYVYK